MYHTKKHYVCDVENPRSEFFRFFSKKTITIAAGLILSLTACDSIKPPKELDRCTHKIEISDSDTANLAVRNARRQVHKALSGSPSPVIRRRFYKFESTWIKARQFQNSDPYVELKIIELKTLLNEASLNRSAFRSTFKDLNDHLIPGNWSTSEQKFYQGSEGNSDLEWADEAMEPLRGYIVEAKKSVLRGDFFLVNTTTFEYDWENANAILKENACRQSSPSEYNAAKVEIKSKLTELKTLINKYSEREFDVMVGRDSFSRAEKDAALSILEDLNSALNKLGMPDPDS